MQVHLLGGTASAAQDLASLLSLTLANELQTAQRRVEISAFPVPSPSATATLASGPAQAALPPGCTTSQPDEAVLRLLLGSTGATDSPNGSEQRDWQRQWRGLLDAQGLHYQVIHGNGTQQLQQALACIRQQTALRPLGQPRERGKPWVWACEKCSDSACEHRLLSDLIQSRQDAAGAPNSPASPTAA